MKAHSTVACRQNTCNKAADIKEADSAVQFEEKNTPATKINVAL